MKKSPKKSTHEQHQQEPEKNNEEGKDFAHYPPAPAEQVKPPAHKEKKHDARQSSGGINNEIPSSAPGTGLERIVNASNKIVNETDEGYSDGSGGGFEATEQVNE